LTGGGVVSAGSFHHHPRRVVATRKGGAYSQGRGYRSQGQITIGFTPQGEPCIPVQSIRN